MDILVDQFSTPNLKTINLCRMYLHVSLLSDITEPNGQDIKKIKISSLHAKVQPNGQTSRIQQGEHGVFGKSHNIHRRVHIDNPSGTMV